MEMFFQDPLNMQGGRPILNEEVPPHVPAPITWRSTCFPASLPCPRTGGDLPPHWNPWLLELGNIKLCPSPTASLQLAGIEPICREEIVMGRFSLDRLWLSSPRKPSRVGWQPGDLGYRHSRSQHILWNKLLKFRFWSTLASCVTWGKLFNFL